MWNTGCYPAQNIKQIHRRPLLSRDSDILPSSAFSKWGPKMQDHYGNWTHELSQYTWYCHTSTLCLGLLHTTCKMMKAFPLMPKGESQPQPRSTNTSSIVGRFPLLTWWHLLLPFSWLWCKVVLESVHDKHGPVPGQELGFAIWSLSLTLLVALTATLPAAHPLVRLPLTCSPCTLIPNSQLCRTAPHYLPFAHHTSSDVSAPCLGFAKAPGPTLAEPLPQTAECNFWLWIWWALREVFSENTSLFLLLPTAFPVHTMYSGERPPVLADLAHFSKETDT